MTLELGVVCGQCDGYAPMGTARCLSCGHDLALHAKPQSELKKTAPTGTAPKAATPALKGSGTLAPAQMVPAPRAPISSSKQRVAASVEAESGTDRRMPLADPVPLSERKVSARPQAPDVLATMQQPRPSPARVEVVRSAEPAPKSKKPVSDDPATWSRDTTGKIPLRPPSGSMQQPSKSREELMDQARNYVCRSCSTPIPSGHKFCGRCGAPVPADILSLREEFYGTFQVPGRAKLILIRAEGDPSMEGLSFALNAQEHIVGRQGHLTFPDDRFVSPRHANLFYRDGTLVVRDEGSLNGVYLRIRGTVDIKPGDMFLAGEEVFRVDATPKASDHPDQEGTYFWSSPKRPSPFRITQVLEGGTLGNTICAKESGIGIGREGGEMNFPTDVYMSATHCRVEADPSGSKLTLTDLNSRNGTYLRLAGERELAHGDYVFIGRKILRVEITS